MNEKIFLKQSNELYYIKDFVNVIQIESIQMYRELISNLFDSVIVSENDKELNIDKNVLVIKDVFSLSLNEKKLLNLLYKSMIKNTNENTTKKEEEIRKYAIQLIEELACTINLNISYNDEYELTKLFSIFQVEFEDNDIVNFLDSLVNYIKVYQLFENINLVISFSLTNYLSSEEYNLLKSELEIMDIKLVDIVYNSKENNHKSLIIDSEYCII